MCHGIFHICIGYPLQCVSFHQRGLILHILDMKGYAVPRRSGLPSKNLSGEHGCSVSGLCISNDLSRSGHLRLQHGDICAALG
jgi:hypothetical protein